MVRRFWDRLGRGPQIALGAGLILAVASVPLPYWLAALIALAASLLLGFGFPDQATRVAIFVTIPILALAYLNLMVRGFGLTTPLILLIPSLILPVVLARAGATARTGET